jgi:hypothetical protein
MKNIIITGVLLSWCVLISFAQTWEIGLSGGITYYVGDLNPTFHFRQPHAAGSIFVKRNFGNHWSLRGGAMYGRVSADDAAGVFAYQGVRNLRFQTDIYEVHGILEFNFFPYRPGDPSTKRWTPYLFLGISGFYFNPQTLYNDVWVNLQPLGTEGQQTQSNPKQTPYNLVQPAIPFGMGLKWSFAERLSLGFEWGMRILFTDYLDDVSKTYGDVNEILLIRGLTAAELSDLSSGETTIENTGFQRGNPTENDWFSYLGVSLSYNIADPVSCYSYKRTWSKKRK